MDRKTFLATSGLLAGGTLLPGKEALAGMAQVGETHRMPPYLREGDTIGITSPAGFITLQELTPAVQVLKSWGFRVKLGATIGKRDFSFGGSDEERALDFQALLDDPGIKAILCARGGYGVVRMVDRLNWKGFRQHPKWVIGFSDVTVLHSHIHRHTQTATLHSKMCNSFPSDWSRAELIQTETILSIREALLGRKMTYTAPPNSSNRAGVADGVLIGGNLKTLETLAGTTSDIDTRGKILFVEDTGEYLYSIDRMFWNLKRTGKLDGLKGLIIGGFKVKPDDPGEEFGRTVADIVLEKVKEKGYPVCFDFPVGHQRANFALVCGMPHRLQVAAEQVSLTQIK